MATKLECKQSSPLLRAQRANSESRAKYVDLSIELKNRAKTGEYTDQPNATYFIYQTGHIQGPYTVSEILGKCVRNEIHLKAEKVLFCPTSLTNTYYDVKHSKIWRSLEELKETGFHDKLYDNLKELQQSNIIIHHPPPPHKTLANKRKKYGLSFHQFIRILSAFIAKILFVIIFLHFIIPLIICTVIYCILFILCCSAKTRKLFSPYKLCVFIGYTLILKDIFKNDGDKPLKGMISEDIKLKASKSKLQFTETHFVSIFIGFTCTPILVVMLTLHYGPIDDDNNINVWMIGYSSWCLFFIIDYFCINLNLWYKNLTKLVTGMHITKVHKQDLLLILCALSASLPAVIIGYVANYILDEKLTLRCTEDIGTDVCMEDINNCCYTVSSHDIHIANVIALFGLIRLISWMVIKADTTLYDVVTETTEPFE